MLDVTKYEREIEDKRGRAQALLDSALENKRELTDGESKEYDTLYGEIAATKRFISDAKEEELNELRSKMAEQTAAPVVADRHAADKLLRGLQSGQALYAIHPELRDWTSASGGASAVVPEDWYNEVIQTRELNGEARRSGMRVIRTNHTNHIPVFNGYGTAATKAEMTAYNEADASLTSVLMGAYKVTQRYDVAEEVLADAEQPIASLLAVAVGNAFATWEDDKFISASGTGSAVDMTPSGIFAKAASASGAAASGITVEELIGIVYGMPRAYRRGAAFFMNDATVGYIARLRTTASAVEGFFWQDSINGEPPRLLGYPVYTNSKIPSYTTASAKIISFANPGFYAIGERGPMEIRRVILNEYSTTFAVSQRMDGHPLVANAFYNFTTSTS